MFHRRNSCFLNSIFFFIFPSTKKRKQRRWASDTGVKLYSGALRGCETGRLVRHFNIRHVCFWAPRVLNPTRHWYSLLKANSSRNHSGPPRDDWAPRGGGSGGGGPFIRVSESHPRTAFCRARSGGHYGPHSFGQAAVSASARTRTPPVKLKSCEGSISRLMLLFPPMFSHVTASVARQSDMRSGFLPFPSPPPSPDLHLFLVLLVIRQQSSHFSHVSARVIQMVSLVSQHGVPLRDWETCGGFFICLLPF